MPQFDGTGPNGDGPRTGWGNGPCGAGGYGRRQPMRGFRRFAGFGRRGGRSWGRQQVRPTDETGVLDEEIASLEDELADLKKQRNDFK